MKFMINFILVLTILWTSVAFPTNRALPPKPIPESMYFGYQIGKNRYVVVAVHENRIYSISLYDPRIAAAPIIIGLSHIPAKLIKLQLPDPDFTSKGALTAKGSVVDFSNSENAMRNFKTDGFFVTTAQKERQGITYYENQLFPLKEILKAGRSVRYLITMVPPINKDYPFRRFQYTEITDGHGIFSVIDTNAAGQAKTLSLFQRNDGEIFQLKGAWKNFDVATDPIVYSRTDERKVLLQNDQVLFHVGEHVSSPYDIMEMHTDSALYTRHLYQKTNRTIDPSWDRQPPPKEKLNTSDLSDAVAFYGVLNFLVESGKMHRSLSPEAHKAISSAHNDNPFEDYSIAQWRPHQKLQVSPLGIMTYQDSPSQRPLFLGLIGNNPPVHLTKIGGRLRITFEQVNITEYDLKTGQPFRVSKVMVNKCHSLFQ